MFDVFFGTEDGGDIFLQNVVDFQRTTQCYILADSKLLSPDCAEVTIANPMD
jgi:hypothetical protein